MKTSTRISRRKGAKADDSLLGIGTIINIPEFGGDKNVKMTLTEIVPLSKKDIKEGLGTHSYHFVGSKNRSQYYPSSKLKKRLAENSIEIINRMKEAGTVSPRKARRILHDKKVHGKPLTPAQYGFFGARASGYPVKKGEGGSAEQKAKVDGLEKQLTDKGVVFTFWDENGIGVNAEYKGGAIEEYNYATDEGTEKLPKDIADLIDDYNHAVDDYYESEKKDGGGFSERAKSIFGKGYQKTKELAGKGIEATKKGYHATKQYTKDKIHDQKKNIALNVLDETRAKVDSKKESRIVNMATSIVESEYKEAGQVDLERKAEAVKTAVKISVFAYENSIDADVLSFKEFSEKVFDKSGISYPKADLELAYKAMRQVHLGGGGSAMAGVDEVEDDFISKEYLPAGWEFYKKKLNKNDQIERYYINKDNYVVKISFWHKGENTPYDIMAGYKKDDKYIQIAIKMGELGLFPQYSEIAESNSEAKRKAIEYMEILNKEPSAKLKRTREKDMLKPSYLKEGGSMAKGGKIEEGDDIDITFKEDTEIEVFTNKRQINSGKGEWQKYKKGETETYVDVLSINKEGMQVQFGNGDVANIHRKAVDIKKSFSSGGSMEKAGQVPENLVEKLKDKYGDEIKDKGITEIFIDPYGDFRMTSEYDIDPSWAEAIEKDARALSGSSGEGSVSTLISFAESNEKLIDEKAGIMNMADEMKWNSERLHQQFKRIFSYMAETSYNKENPDNKIELTEAERHEFADLLTNSNGNNNAPVTEPVSEPAEPNVKSALQNLSDANAKLDEAEGHADSAEDTIEEAKRNVDSAVDDLEGNKFPFKNAGRIPNNYSGKTPEQVWDLWTPEQRTQFIEDHYFCEKGFKQKRTANLQLISAGETLMKYIELDWEKIPDVPIKRQLDSTLYNHIEHGQYAGGGTTYAEGSKAGDKKFSISFNGRERGAIGIFYPITETINARDEDEAIDKLFNKYEGHGIKIDGTPYDLTRRIKEEKTKSIRMTPEKKKLEEKIKKLERALAGDKMSAKSRATMQKQLEEYTAKFNRRVPVYERIVQSKGKFYIEIPAEYRLKMNTLLHGTDLKPRLNELEGKLRITVDNKPKLNRLYKIYSAMLTKKKLPVPTLEEISGSPKKVKAQK